MKLPNVYSRLTPTLGLWAGLHCCLLAESPNLLKNPGFEEDAEVDLRKMAGEVLDRGVQLPSGDPAVMPATVYINPSDGWGRAGQETSFEYVAGKAGDAVHTGRRAIHIVAPKARVGTAFGKQIPVVEGVGLEDEFIVVNKVCPFSFYAKGQGSVVVNCYMYGHKGLNLYDYAANREVQPANIAVDDDGQ